ncbi:hypothetical protein [Janthinobacterium lividum]|uniref:hypothetical protein n=1 Tax=Janthinobacterium lividum TaxID=29581 RepID=UPI0015954F17|nr:hypothetical protein [Janthinobacterium lividum]QKY12082.1 hypothetical protein G8765_29810 [Janthinobacterium lividum]
MMSKNKLRIYFSDFFGVSPESVTDYGAFNISLINDLPLFIDPFLLFNSDNPEYQRLHKEMIDYVVFLKSKSGQDLPEGLIKSWFYFPEIKQNWLGYSKTGNNGRGLGPVFAASLKRNLTSLFRNFGDLDDKSPHLEKLTLVKNGVGRDHISDFTCNLICGFLAKYTEDFALKYLPKSKLGKFNIPKVTFNKNTETWAAKQFTLPKFGNQFVLLTPIDILTKDESWISHQGLVEDYSQVLASVDNDQLRAQINKYFTQNLPIDATKQQLSDTLEMVIERFPQVLDAYVKLKERDKAGASKHREQKIGEAQDIFLDQCTELAESLDQVNFYDLPEKDFSSALEKVKLFRDVLESQAGENIFFSGAKPISREEDITIMFKLVWLAASCEEPNDNKSEKNSAKILYGEDKHNTIELKLAKNGKMQSIIEEHAKKIKLPSFEKSPPIRAIIAFKRREITKIDNLITKNGLSARKEFVLIDLSQDD